MPPIKTGLKIPRNAPELVHAFMVRIAGVGGSKKSARKTAAARRNGRITKPGGRSRGRPRLDGSPAQPRKFAVVCECQRELVLPPIVVTQLRRDRHVRLTCPHCQRKILLKPALVGRPAPPAAG